MKSVLQLLTLVTPFTYVLSFDLILPSTLISSFPAIAKVGVSAASGAAGAAAAYPIDFVKSLLQTEKGRNKYGSDGIKAAIDVIRSSPLGPMGLYRGCLVQIAGIAPEKAIKLSCNDAMRNLMATQMGQLSIGAEIVSGGIAGFMQVIVTNPLEVVKVKLQTSSKNYTLSDVLEEVGDIAGFYKGSSACISRDVIFSAILFPCYAHLKPVIPSLITSTVSFDVDPLVLNLIAGAAAAAPSAFVATPFDTVKTRLQQSREVDNGNMKNACESLALEADMNAIELFRTLDVDVLFSGWYQRVLRSSVQFGVTLSLFDILTMKVNEILV